MHRPRRRMPRYLAVALAAAVVPGLAATGTATAAPRATGTAAVASGANESLVRTGTANVRNIALAAKVVTPKGSQGPEISPVPDLDKPAASSGASNLPPPSPANTAVQLHRDRLGFEGLTHTDQRLASGGNQFSLEPPDQGLCVGGYNGQTYVVESVNDALRFFDSRGFNFALPPFSLSEFYGLPPTINRTTGKFGPFISDPKCYFDPDTHHWFHTALVLSLDPKTGAFTTKYAYTALAVSQTADPLGNYYIYRINALDKGNKNCPCFGDQPLIGADKNGFYVSTAEYDLDPFGAHFNGAQLYAISKRALENGTAATVKHYRNITTQSGTLQPATSPNGQYESAAGGTEYFVSGRDTLLPDGRLRPGQVNQVTVWALTNTSSLDSRSPSTRLTGSDVKTEVYGQPVPMTQRSGPRPLGNAVGEPKEKLNANDERVNQVVYAAGHLFTGVNTIVAPGPRTGIAWFVLDPSVAGGRASATVHSQGYVAVKDANVAFPAIGVNAAGQGVMAMSLVGKDYYPSAAYVKINSSGTTGSVQIAQLGFRPEDGFTGYKAFGGNGVARWGDYFAAVAGPDGRIWNAVEFIGDQSRTEFANWSTFVFPVTP